MDESSRCRKKITKVNTSIAGSASIPRRDCFKAIVRIVQSEWNSLARFEKGLNKQVFFFCIFIKTRFMTRKFFNGKWFHFDFVRAEKVLRKIIVLILGEWIFLSLVPFLNGAFYFSLILITLWHSSAIIIKHFNDFFLKSWARSTLWNYLRMISKKFSVWERKTFVSYLNVILFSRSWCVCVIPGQKVSRFCGLELINPNLMLEGKVLIPFLSCFLSSTLRCIQPFNVLHSQDKKRSG